MLEIKEYLDVWVSEVSKKIQIDTQQLNRCPKGHLMKTKNHKKEVVYWVTYKDGQRIRKIVTNDLEVQAALAQKGMLEEEIKNLKGIKKALQDASEEIGRVSTLDRGKYLLNHISWFSSQMRDMAAAYDAAEEEWLRKPYHQSTYKEETRIYVTSRGLRVKSKSEQIIAELLYKYGIAFRYEQVVPYEGYELAPDFTIRRRDGKIFYWEHHGMMTIDRYRSIQKWKYDAYEQLDIVPWDNLIATYDQPDGTINIKEIEGIIKSKLLV